MVPFILKQGQEINEMSRTGKTLQIQSVSSANSDKYHNYCQFSPMQWEDKTTCTGVLGEVDDTVEQK